MALFGSSHAPYDAMIHGPAHQPLFDAQQSFIKRLRNLTITMVLTMPLLFTIVRAIPILVSSLIVTHLFYQAQVRITRASMISIGLAQGILDSYSSIGKDITLLSSDER